MIKLKELSIIIPLYNEAESLNELYNEIINQIKDKDYEIIFIDDGSHDNSFNVLNDLHQKNPERVKIVRFRRNYGKSAALCVGFEQAAGNIVITMDADLQDDPKEIPNFINKINEGYDLVSGWKFKRNDPISKTLPSKFFNYVTSRATGLKLHDINCGFKAYKKDVTENLNVYGELHRYLPVLAFWQGYKVGEIKVNHHARKYSYSKFGFERHFHGLFDFLTVLFLLRYKKRPLHLFGIWGFVLVTSGGGISLYLLYLRIIYGSILGKLPLLSFAVLMIIVGIQFISIGLLGEMIANISKQKDDYSIKEMIGFDNEN